MDLIKVIIMNKITKIIHLNYVYIKIKLIKMKLLILILQKKEMIYLKDNQTERQLKTNHMNLFRPNQTNDYLYLFVLAKMEQ
jgi:hypothetical protein